MKIVVTGQIARYPLGGVTWDWLNYLLGFRKLGHTVHYFEDGPKWLYNPVKNTVMLSDYNINYLKKVMNEYGFSSNWTYISRDRFHNDKIYGNSDIANIFKSADIIFNICGASNMGTLVSDFPVIKKIKKVFVDVDPMINQLKILKKDKNLVDVFHFHDHFFTYAENIKQKDCKIPLNNKIKWITTRFPIYLPAWRSLVIKKSSKFTTIANWQSYKGFSYKGERYFGSKNIEFLKFSNLPKISGEKMEIAMIADTEKNEKDTTWISNKNGLDKMKNGGFHISNARIVSKDWKVYKKYVESSKGEWSVAKNIYVKAHTGWFSGRSACYLASGKPVILEETGFSKFIPTGKGLFSFKNMSEAVSAIDEINKNYRYHSNEARKVAEKYFDSNKVLRKMLKDCNVKNK